EDEENVSAFFEVILNADFTRLHDLWCGNGNVGGDQTILGGFVISERNHDPVAKPCAADIHEEPRVLLFIDQPVFRLGCAEAVVENLRRTVILIKAGIEEASVRSVPFARAASILDQIVQIPRPSNAANLQRVELRTLVIIAPQEA